MRMERTNLAKYFSLEREGPGLGTRERSTQRPSKVSLVFYSLNDITYQYGKMASGLGDGFVHVR